MEGTEESVDTNKFEDDDRKLFVGGLTWETTVEQLKAYFEKYGTVKVSVIHLGLPSSLHDRLRSGQNSKLFLFYSGCFH